MELKNSIKSQMEISLIEFKFLQIRSEGEIKKKDEIIGCCNSINADRTIMGFFFF